MANHDDKGDVRAPGRYLHESRPILKQSFVLYLDVLGSADMAKSDRAQEYLDKVHRALTSARDFGLHDEHESYLSYSFATFTDHIAVGCPILTYSDGERELDVLTMEAAWYQFALAREGLFVRGGLTVGEVCFSKEFAFGPALIEAVEIEQGPAKFPRILLSPTVRKRIENHHSMYTDWSESPYNTDYLIDGDGAMFVNYLGKVDLEITDTDATMGVHRAAVLEALTEHASNIPVFEKYEWLAHYHNYWCLRRYSDLPSYQIDLSPRPYTFCSLSEALGKAG